MGALDRQLELTDLGRILARLPIEPLLGKTIVMGVAFGVGTLMCDIAASSSFSSPFVPRERTHTRLNSAQRSFAGDRWSDHVAL
ncbi:HA2 domain-containing protein, partial [Trichostrongylus colubriformis]